MTIPTYLRHLDLAYKLGYILDSQTKDTVVAGNAGAELQVLASVSSLQIAAIGAYLEKTPITVEHADTPHIFDIAVTPVMPSLSWASGWLPVASLLSSPLVFLWDRLSRCIIPLMAYRIS